MYMYPFCKFVYFPETQKVMCSKEVCRGLKGSHPVLTSPAARGTQAVELRNERVRSVILILGAGRLERTISHQIQIQMCLNCFFDFVHRWAGSL